MEGDGITICNKIFYVYGGGVRVIESRVYASWLHEIPYHYP